MHEGIILEFYFCYDSDLDERSRGISGTCLHRISLRMYLDGLGSYSDKTPTVSLYILPCVPSLGFHRNCPKKAKTNGPSTE